MGDAEATGARYRLNERVVEERAHRGFPQFHIKPIHIGAELGPRFCRGVVAVDADMTSPASVAGVEGRGSRLTDASFCAPTVAASQHPPR